MASKGLPRPSATIIRKNDLLKSLKAIDDDKTAGKRVLSMETLFRTKIQSHIESLPTQDAKFTRFNTSPFVLLFYSLQHGYNHIQDIEQAILPAKVFSSMETSAGRMVETVALPEYSWEIVPSEMHSINSALDAKKIEGDILKLVTLKSGPRCLNDEMSENFADAIIANCEQWAADGSVKKIDFTYGVLYGTQKQSNKKDWHILRNIREKLPGLSVTLQPDNRWDCAFTKGDVTVTVSIRIGVQLWNYIGGQPTTFTELCVALIRACITPTDADPDNYNFLISDLPQIISLDSVPDDFNVAILQRSQLEWLFFVARHFCDEIQ